MTNQETAKRTLARQVFDEPEHLRADGIGFQGQAMLDAYSIGDSSQLSGVNVETIRYYEKVGLLPAPNRASNGSREYDGTSLERGIYLPRLETRLYRQ